MAQRVSTLLRRANQLLSAEFCRREPPITLGQLCVLLVLKDGETKKQGNILQETGLDRSTASEMIRRMRVDGLVQTERMDHDARAVGVKITSAGRKALNQAEPLLALAEAEVMRKVGRTWREGFLKALDAVAA